MFVIFYLKKEKKRKKERRDLHDVRNAKSSIHQDGIRRKRHLHSLKTAIWVLTGWIVDLEWSTANLQSDVKNRIFRSSEAVENHEQGAL